MFCEKCGAKNIDGTVYCENCGARIAPEVQPQQAYQPAVENPAFNKSSNNSGFSSNNFERAFSVSSSAVTESSIQS